MKIKLTKEHEEINRQNVESMKKMMKRNLESPHSSEEARKLHGWWKRKSI